MSRHIRSVIWKFEKTYHNFAANFGIGMAKNLVIVESPAKAKTIEGFLGKDFKVLSSFGHIRDLSHKDMGVDVSSGLFRIMRFLLIKKRL